eukprot:jgi/Botrbrau1/6546/Bobra.40_2s0017.1
MLWGHLGLCTSFYSPRPWFGGWAATFLLGAGKEQSLTTEDVFNEVLKYGNVLYILTIVKARKYLDIV